MWRGAFVAMMLALALAPAAFAQEEEDEPTPTPTPVAGCERGPGTDADYADCEPPDARCDEEGTDADYVYGCCRDVDGTDADYVYACPQFSNAPTAGPPPPSPPPPAAVQALGAQPALPMTGSEPLLLALSGLGFLLAGAGLRLRTRRVVP